MDGRVQVEKRYQEKQLRNQLVIEDLQKQIHDQQAIVTTNTGDNDNLNGQVQEKEARVADREEEIRAVRE